MKLFTRDRLVVGNEERSQDLHPPPMGMLLSALFPLTRHTRRCKSDSESPIWITIRDSERFGAGARVDGFQIPPTSAIIEVDRPRVDA